MKNVHSLKVHYKSISFENPQRYALDYKKVPIISLSGEWLRKCGFEIDDKVDVFIGKEMLVIKKNDTMN